MKPLRSITVKQLITALQNENEDALVVFAYNYGDYGHTPAVDAIRVIDMREIEPSAYSNSGFAVKQLENDEPLDTITDNSVVVLSSEYF